MNDFLDELTGRQKSMLSNLLEHRDFAGLSTCLCPRWQPILVALSSGVMTREVPVYLSEIAYGVKKEGELAPSLICRNVTSHRKPWMHSMEAALQRARLLPTGTFRSASSADEPAERLAVAFYTKGPSFRTRDSQYVGLPSESRSRLGLAQSDLDQ